MSVPLPSEALARVTEALRQLYEVDVPDFLDSEPESIELYTLFVVLDTWETFIQMIRGKTARRATIR